WVSGKSYAGFVLCRNLCRNLCRSTFVAQPLSLSLCRPAFVSHFVSHFVEKMAEIRQSGGQSGGQSAEIPAFAISFKLETCRSYGAWPGFRRVVTIDMAFLRSLPCRAAPGSRVLRLHRRRQLCKTQQPQFSIFAPRDQLITDKRGGIVA